MKSKISLSKLYVPSTHYLHPSQSTSCKSSLYIHWFHFLSFYSYVSIHTSQSIILFTISSLCPWNTFLIPITHPIFLVLDLLPQLKSPPTYPYFDKSQSYLQHQRFLWVPFRQHYLKVLQASLAQGRPPKTWSFSYIPWSEHINRISILLKWEIWTSLLTLPSSWSPNQYPQSINLYPKRSLESISFFPFPLLLPCFNLVTSFSRLRQWSLNYSSELHSWPSLQPSCWCPGVILNHNPIVTISLSSMAGSLKPVE